MLALIRWLDYFVNAKSCSLAHAEVLKRHIEADFLLRLIVFLEPLQCLQWIHKWTETPLLISSSWSKPAASKSKEAISERRCFEVLNSIKPRFSDKLHV